jgi:hypothetical protein
VDDPAELDQLAFHFFKEFARCEYSLKMAGLRTGGDRNPGANWSQLAREIQASLESPSSLALKNAVAYYLQSPPHKQILKDGLLDWDNVLPCHESKAELLLLLICRVRNNLFHGGKFNGHWFAPQRSKELLSHGLVILAASVEAHPQVKEAYELRAA